MPLHHALPDFASVAQRFGLSEETNHLFGTINGYTARIEYSHHSEGLRFLERTLLDRDASDPNDFRRDREIVSEAVVRITVALATPLDLKLKVRGGILFPTLGEFMNQHSLVGLPRAPVRVERNGQHITAGDARFDRAFIADCQEAPRGQGLLSPEIRQLLCEMAEAGAGVSVNDHRVMVTLRNHCFAEPTVTRMTALAVLAAQAVQRARALVPPPFGMNAHARMLEECAAYQGFSNCGALWVRGQVGSSQVEIHSTNGQRVAARVRVGWGVTIEETRGLITRGGGSIERACALVLEAVTSSWPGFWGEEPAFETFVDSRPDSPSFLKQLLTPEIRGELTAIARIARIAVDPTWLTASQCDFVRAPLVADRLLSVAAMAQELFKPARVASKHPYR